jgi:hypothetical protein
MMRIILAILASCLSIRPAAATDYDVVVYGATPAGVTAAVAAAQEGSRTVVIEPLPLVGGMMSGGLSFSDSNQMARECLGGLFETFHRRVEKDYANRGVQLPYRVADKDQKPWTYEPHVAERVFEAMLREAGVRVVLNETLASVEKDGPAIKSIRTTAGRRFVGKVFIDASYEGDLLAAAGVKYRVGREGKDEYDESLAGVRFPKKPVAVLPRDDRKMLLPLLTGEDPGKEGQGDQKIMTYSFRLCLTEEPKNRVPIDKPDTYDPARYELFRRYYRANPKADLLFDLIAIPGGKFDGNNGIRLPLSLGLVGGNWDYPEGDAKKRAAIWEDHKRYTEGLLYFLANDSDVPDAVRKRMGALGYAKDEFSRSAQFPPVLYVREARRMVGMYFLTQADILDKVVKADPIGVGSFPIDSHDCQRVATADGFNNEGTIFPVHIAGRKIGQPHHLPYRSITPKAEECTNLLVPVCVSSSHVAFSSVRVEPTWMVLGESAGVAAAMAASANSPVQKVDAAKLAKRLKDRGQVLDLPNAGPGK